MLKLMCVHVSQDKHSARRNLADKLSIGPSTSSKHDVSSHTEEYNCLRCIIVYRMALVWIINHLLKGK